MNFTFAITTDYSDENRLNQIVKSIRNLKIPKYEILMIGGKKQENNLDTYHIFMDDPHEKGGLPGKKIY